MSPNSRLTPEQQADMSGRRLTRNERKQLIIEELATCSPEQLAQIRMRSAQTIAHLASTRLTQAANGIVLTDAQHDRNIARDLLTLECLDALENRPQG